MVETCQMYEKQKFIVIIVFKKVKREYLVLHTWKASAISHTIG